MKTIVIPGGGAAGSTVARTALLCSNADCTPSKTLFEPIDAKEHGWFIVDTNPMPQLEDAEFIIRRRSRSSPRLAACSVGSWPDILFACAEEQVVRPFVLGKAQRAQSFSPLPPVQTGYSD